MARWIRFEHDGEVGFGTLDDDTITTHEGDMFAGAEATSRTVSLASVKLLTPTEPTTMIAIWNNFNAMSAKFDLGIPPEPLYLLKATTSFLAGGETIRRPKSYDGRVVFEGEIGIVIGRETRAVSESEAERCVFGYTCINDVTAFELINKDKSFAQWTRSKSFDTFGVFGPVVATGLDPAGLAIKTTLNGEERQNYPVSDMIFQPLRLVSLISQDMTLCPGDVIACGTSLGAGSMKPGSTIEVSIVGIGTLSNRFE
jgi:2-keto-4-pentenoate hydratase/2-oxohepta-3-ene-1,7-dioic acid hydratase in catechol pathway